jgi:glycosyltransferase involved in cell wall biosynthesis
MKDDYFRETYPSIPESRFYKIPYLGFGGIDTDMFNSVDVASYDDFTITYAGSFYEGWIEPYAFLEGVKEYVNRHGSDGLQVRFYGDWRDEYQQEVKNKGLEDIVTSYDPIPYEDIIAVLKKSDLLLYIGGNDPRNELNIPLKIADYVAAHSPILGVVNPAFRAGEFIEKNDIGVVVPPTEPKSIADAIHAVRSGEFEYNAEDSLLNRFDSQRAMKEYASILDEISEDI